MNDTTRSLTYVGAGNIGSQAIEDLARMPSLEHLTLIDPDVYETRNLSSQAISRRDVGKRKVDVLASRVRGVNPRLRVETIAAPVQAVPLGRLRAQVIATGLDTLAARRWVSRAAWRLGVPWVDAGVRAEGRLARVDVFGPAPDAACLECAWGEVEHAALDRSYPCDGVAVLASTDAPAHLGALAASLQCAECSKLLRGDMQNALIGQQLLVETTTHRRYVTRRERAPGCRFDHRRWAIQHIVRAPGAITLVQALNLPDDASTGPARLRLHGDAFVHRLRCPHCNASRDVLHLASRMDSRACRCASCAGLMLASGIDTTDTLALEHCAGRHRRVSLFALGLRYGDVFSIERPSGAAHFEIGEP